MNRYIETILSPISIWARFLYKNKIISYFVFVYGWSVSLSLSRTSISRTFSWTCLIISINLAVMKHCRQAGSTRSSYSDYLEWLTPIRLGHTLSHTFTLMLITYSPARFIIRDHEHMYSITFIPSHLLYHGHIHFITKYHTSCPSHIT